MLFGTARSAVGVLTSGPRDPTTQTHAHDCDPRASASHTTDTTPHTNNQPTTQRPTNQPTVHTLPRWALRQTTCQLASAGVSKGADRALCVRGVCWQVQGLGAQARAPAHATWVARAGGHVERSARELRMETRVGGRRGRAYLRSRCSSSRGPRHDEQEAARRVMGRRRVPCEMDITSRLRERVPSKVAVRDGQRQAVLIDPPPPVLNPDPKAGQSKGLPWWAVPGARRAAGCTAGNSGWRSRRLCGRWRCGQLRYDPPWRHERR